MTRRRITKAVRDEAAMICAVVASRHGARLGFLAHAMSSAISGDGEGHKHVSGFAWDAYRACERVAGRADTEEARAWWAEAAQLLWEGWTP